MVGSAAGLIPEDYLEAGSLWDHFDRCGVSFFNFGLGFASYMADNDLALARVLNLLTRSPYWKEMAIFVIEDDAQNGRDHIDAHRSLCLVVSPDAKRGSVSQLHTSIPSIIKTINLIHGMPYINQYDAMTSDLSDLFQAAPDETPYPSVKVDSRIFDLDRAYEPLDEEFNWDAVNDFPALDPPDVLKRWTDEDAVRRAEPCSWVRRRHTDAA